MAKYNFTSYLVRNFDLVIDEQNGLHRMQVKGFRNYDEARQYANDIYQHQAITQLLSKGARGIVISEPNLLLLGTSLSYDDYTLFYTQHLASPRFTPSTLMPKRLRRLASPMRRPAKLDVGITTISVSPRS